MNTDNYLKRVRQYLSTDREVLVLFKLLRSIPDGLTVVTPIPSVFDPDDRHARRNGLERLLDNESPVAGTQLFVVEIVPPTVDTLPASFSVWPHGGTYKVNPTRVKTFTQDITDTELALLAELNPQTTLPESTGTRTTESTSYDRNPIFTD